jgi:hypothetical protein
MEPASDVENVTVKPDPLAPSTSSRIIQPKLEELPETKLATLAVTFHGTYCPTDPIVHPPPPPTVTESVLVPDAGLLMAVPNGWLFHVMADSVHAELTAKTSSIRHAAAGIAVTQRRKVALVTVAELGTFGAHVVRSKETYERRSRLLRDSLFMVVAPP